MEPPVLITGPDNVTEINLHETAQLSCTFSSSEIPYLGICVWDKGNVCISQSHINQISVPGRRNELACSLTIARVTKSDEGKYYCYCYYNESFWEKFHFPKYSNIRSQSGETVMYVQLIEGTGKYHSHLICTICIVFLSGHNKLQEILEIVVSCLAAIAILILTLYLIKRWCKKSKGPTDFALCVLEYVYVQESFVLIKA